MKQHYTAHSLCVALRATSGLPLDHSKGRALDASRICGAFSAVVKAAAQH